MFIRKGSFREGRGCGVLPKCIHPSARSRVPDVNDASGIAHQPPLDLWLSPEHIKSRCRDRKAKSSQLKRKMSWNFKLLPPTPAPLPSKHRGLLSSLSFPIPLNGAQRGKKRSESEWVSVLWVSKSRKPYKKNFRQQAGEEDNSFHPQTVRNCIVLRDHGHPCSV